MNNFQGSLQKISGATICYFTDHCKRNLEQLFAILHIMAKIKNFQGPCQKVIWSNYLLFYTDHCKRHLEQLLAILRLELKIFRDRGERHLEQLLAILHITVGMTNLQGSWQKYLEQLLHITFGMNNFQGSWQKTFGATNNYFTNYELRIFSDIWSNYGQLQITVRMNNFQESWQNTSGATIGNFTRIMAKDIWSYN